VGQRHHVSLQADQVKPAKAWPGHSFPTTGTAALDRDGEPAGKGGRGNAPSDCEITLGQIDSPAWSGVAGRRRNRGGGARSGCGEGTVDGVDSRCSTSIPAEERKRMRWRTSGRARLLAGRWLAAGRGDGRRARVRACTRGGETKGERESLRVRGKRG
jgi:hypothetical protein